MRGRRFAVASIAAATALAAFACVGDDPDPGTSPAPPDGSPGGDSAPSDVGTSNDSGNDGGGSVDSGPPTCKVDAPFTSVARSAELSTASGDFGYTTSSDGLTAYLSFGAVTNELYVTRRPTTNDPFLADAATLLIGTPTGSKSYPSLSEDGNELFFTYLGGSGAQDMWVGHPVDGGIADASTVVSVNAPDAATADERGYLANPHALYFTRNTTDAATLRIYRAERAATSGPFDGLALVAGLGTLQSESSPVPTSDELATYFAGGSGPEQIYLAVRGSVNDAFGTPTKVTELAAAGARNIPVWLSQDRCTLYFTTNRDNASNFDLWVAKRQILK